MRPPADIQKLGRYAVLRPGAHRWFTWFPPPMSWLSIGFVHSRGTREWAIASVGAPR